MAQKAANGKSGGVALDAYLRDIARLPLLSRDEEAALARRIHRGDRDALNDLVQGNLRFVVNVAKGYSKQGVPLEDLINEGNIGLIKAAGRFDETRGFKFISYAVWWIRQAILQALAEQSRIVRVPLNRVGQLYRVGKTQQRMEQELQREPTNAEIAERLGLKESDVSTSLFISNSHVCLDSAGPGNEDGSMVETLVNEEQAAVDEDLIADALVQELDSALMQLKEREARILRMYFGIGSGRTQTLEAIGQELGLTRERIRQIKEKALQKLRNVARDRELELFLES